MSDSLSSKQMRYYALHSGALVEVHHPEYSSAPIYVLWDDVQPEIERLRVALRKILDEAVPMGYDVGNYAVEKLAREALGEQPVETTVEQAMDEFENGGGPLSPDSK